MTGSSTDAKRVEITVEPDVQPQRIDSYLGQHPASGVTRTKAQKLIDDGLVLLNGEVPSKKENVKPGDVILVTIVGSPPHDIVAEDIPLDILFEDQYLAVVNKPAGMVTHPGAGNYSGTLVNALVYHFRTLSQSSSSDRPGIVHRLDKDTSGLLVVARDDDTYLKLQNAIQKRELKRTYLALVCGHVRQDTGQIDLPVGRSGRDRKKMAVTEAGGREAITKYKLLRRYRSYDLLEVSLQTGRTHQIRVHFSHLGHPVFGDPQYGGREKWHRGIFAPERPLAKKLLALIKRQALHAARLEFDHPVTGKKISLSSNPPSDFAGVIELLDAEGS